MRTYLYLCRRNDELARVEEAFIRILGLVSVALLKLSLVQANNVGDRNLACSDRLTEK
jgi:hypothetical protein